MTVPAGEASWSDTVNAYYRLTKPRIIVLLLITTVPAMILADHGIPSLWLIAATLVGGTLAAGSANASTCTWTATSTRSCGEPANGRSRPTR